MSDDLTCARCGLPRMQHHYNGACYGVCGEFMADAMSDDKIERMAEAIAKWDGTDWHDQLGRRECSRDRYRAMARAAADAMSDETRMKHHWMGEPIDDMPRERLLEIIDFMGRELGELRSDIHAARLERVLQMIKCFRRDKTQKSPPTQ
jgi:hypothetical protein